MNRWHDWLWRIVLTLLTIVTALVLWGLWAFSCPVSLSALTKVKAGMKRTEVESLLGAPTSTSADGLETRYYRPLGWEIVYLEFDRSGILVKLTHDR